MPLHLYNTLSRKKEALNPLEPGHVRMYVCGPTVYDRPHLGNARSVVVYDVLYRLLQRLYPKVTYVRNITDVDDKINAQAKANGEPISALTARVEGWFHDDMAALNCLSPTVEPHATAHIPQMIAINEKLIASGHAYVSQGHVLFAVSSYAEYGRLSGRKLDELVAGARVEVESYKRHPGDFVLWKPAEAGDDDSSVFDSPWGPGRPGWHIECSAMSSTYLGVDFDIHGGGADLMFPHHENEIAQSCCSAPGSAFARLWVHNGFLTVGGEKMSKSLGNFTTVKDVLDKGVKGEVIRLALLSSKYNEPLDWNEKLVEDAKKTLDRFNHTLRNVKHGETVSVSYPAPVLNALCDDLNIPAALSHLHEMANSINAKPNSELTAQLLLSLDLLGLISNYESNESDAPSKSSGGASASSFFVSGRSTADFISVDVAVSAATVSANWFGLMSVNHDEKAAVEKKVEARIAAKKAKNWAEADRIRKELADSGILLEDRPDGTTDWRRA